MTSKSGSVNWAGVGYSMLLHILFLVPTAYVSYLCALRGTSLIMWHVACFTIGCGLLMTEATLAISGEALLAAKVSRAWRNRIHWILHVLGLMLVVAGTATVYVWKVRRGSRHMKSDHAIVGFAGTVVSVVVAIGGIPILYPKALSKIVSLSIQKILHGFLGISAMALLMAGQITGLYTRWWQASDIGRTITMVVYSVGIILLLVRPLYTTLIRGRNLFTS